MSSPYGKIALHDRKMCLATKHIGDEYSWQYENRILLSPDFVRLNGVPVLRWLEGLEEGSISNSYLWNWNWDYSVAIEAIYNPPTGSGSFSGESLSYYDIGNIGLMPTGEPSWSQSVASHLGPVTLDAGDTWATYETSGTNTKTRVLSNPTIIGMSNIAFRKFRYYDNTYRKTRTIKAGAHVKESVDNSVKEPGTYHLHVLFYTKINYSLSDVNDATYHLTRSDFPERWPQTKQEGKKRFHNGYFIDESGSSIGFTVSRNSEGKLYVSDFDEYFEIETHRFTKSGDTGFAGNIDIPDGFKARGRTRDLFTISL